jgi:predicted phage terminase large subunit-like protein
MFNRNILRLAMYRPNKEPMRRVIAIDASAKDNIESDCNAVSVIGYCDRMFYVLECQNFGADVLSVCQCVREMRQRWGQVPVLVEAKANGTAVMQILRRETSGIVEINPCKDKVERAMEVKHLFDGGNVFFAIRGLEWATVLSQFLAFPHSEHDDIVDSVVHGLKWLNNLAGVQPKASSEARKSEQARRRVTYSERRYYGNSGYCP